MIQKSESTFSRLGKRESKVDFRVNYPESMAGKILENTFYFAETDHRSVSEYDTLLMISDLVKLFMQNYFKGILAT